VISHNIAPKQMQACWDATEKQHHQETNGTPTPTPQVRGTRTTLKHTHGTPTPTPQTGRVPSRCTRTTL
jgi:hypothetical protein